VAFFILKEKKMTIYSQENKVTYISDGKTSSYVVPFYFLDNNISVYLNDKKIEEGEGYIINKSSTSKKGDISLLANTLSGDKITIARDTKLTQEIIFLEGENFPASDFELSLDKIVMSLQELKENLSRCITLNHNTELTSNDISNFLILANKNFQTILNFENTVNQFKNLEARLTTKVGPLTIATSDIIEDNTYSEYPYHLDISISNAKSTHSASIIFNLDDAISGNIAPVTECYDGYVRIYLKNIPTKDTLEVPIILLQ